MLHAQGHFSFPSLLPDYCRLPAGPGAHSCRQGIPGCLFHGRFLPACFMCFMCCCSQQARIAPSGTSQVRQCWLARASCKPCTKWDSLGYPGTNDPCILSGGTTAQSTYMHDTAQHMSELLETLHGGLPPDNARPGLEPGGGLVSPRAAQFAPVSVLSSPLC